MEPLFPEALRTALSSAAEVLWRESSALSAPLPRDVRDALVARLHQINSYYSNRIEGHETHPFDIERAVNRKYSGNAAIRALQEESIAHIAVQNLLEARLRAEPDLNVCSPEFLCWIHREFYLRLPEEFAAYTDGAGKLHHIRPGELRDRDVVVGRHVPPAHASLPDFLARFAEVYDPASIRTADGRVTAAAASHHRLAWIHPFMDGNGRVTRLFSHAYFIRIGLDAHGLWTISRGLARNRDRYFGELEAADEPRRGDMDGRGNLSQSGLLSFCKFFLDCAIDQVRFMTGLLDLPAIERRMKAYVRVREANNELAPESFYILRDLLVRGEIPRGEMARITGRPERTARRILETLLHENLVGSTTPKGPVSLRFPVKVSPYYFPGLYPAGLIA